jgi:hypothetical protein
LNSMQGQSVRYWQPGDIVVLRYYETAQTARMVHAYIGDPALIAGIPFLAGGVIQTIMARPYVVIEDSAALTALYQPPGVPLPRWHVAEGRLLDQVRTARGQSLRLLYPGRAYDITLFFEASDSPWYYDAMFGKTGLQSGWRADRDALGTAETEGAMTRTHNAFRGWYVNMQTPFRRAGVCFDIADRVLDIVVRPDRTWYWKDEDELELCVSRGACTPAEAEEIRRAGREAVDLIESRSPPFDDRWAVWKPPEDLIVTIDQIPDGWQFLPTT